MSGGSKRDIMIHDVMVEIKSHFWKPIDAESIYWIRHGLEEITEERVEVCDTDVGVTVFSPSIGLISMMDVEDYDFTVKLA